MLTRGHLIGEIIDDLAGVAAQVKLRGTLHLFDIHRYIEDFAKEVLNKALQINLVNLNDERCNNPGLDLGDSSSRWAFQVTADKRTDKIKDTLNKIDDEQKDKYEYIRILVLGEKQGSYTFSGEPFDRFNFKEDMVWDLNDVCKCIMALPIDNLVDLAKYVSKEVRRVRIELEIPDDKGQFPNSIDDLIEAIPQPTLSNAAKMRAFIQMQLGHELGENIEEPLIADLSKRLAKLPRQTREVFKVLVERRDNWKAPMTSSFTFSDAKLRRIYRGDDLDGDLALLVESGLLCFENGRHYDRSPFWTICIPGSENYHFNTVFIEYISFAKIDLRKPLVVLDFSDF